MLGKLLLAFDEVNMKLSFTLIFYIVVLSGCGRPDCVIGDKTFKGIGPERCESLRRNDGAPMKFSDIDSKEEAERLRFD